MSTQTATPDLLPTEPTDSDFARLASLVTLERYWLDPECRWAPNDVASGLWDCRNLMDFPLLAFVAMAIARDTKFKDIEDIYLVAAGLIEP